MTSCLLAVDTSLVSVTLTLLEGFGTSCLIFLLTLVFSLPLGLIIAFGSLSSYKPLSAVLKVIVWVIRGTPLMLQLMVIFYGLSMLGVQINEMVATVVAFTINYSCYFSEIYRSGIQAIPKGQYEAGQVLGMSKTQIFSKIVFFQVLRRITPPMGNEIITLVKDTSLARVIFVTEIIFLSFNRYVSQGVIWPLFYSAVFYLVFVGILTLLFGWLEKKMNYYKI